jgi:hypothetical protein
MKYLWALIAVFLMLAYLAPQIVKMKDVALSAVIVIGLVMMGIDLWQSLQSKEE